MTKSDTYFEGVTKYSRKINIYISLQKSDFVGWLTWGFKKLGKFFDKIRHTHSLVLSIIFTEMILRIPQPGFTF